MTHSHAPSRLAENRVEYNTERPYEAIDWNRPKEVHLGQADLTIPNFEREENLPTTWRGTDQVRAFGDREVGDVADHMRTELVKERIRETGAARKVDR